MRFATVSDQASHVALSYREAVGTMQVAVVVGMTGSSAVCKNMLGSFRALSSSRFGRIHKLRRPRSSEESAILRTDPTSFKRLRLGALKSTGIAEELTQEARVVAHPPHNQGFGHG